MTLKCQRQIDTAHPFPVVGDTDHSEPAGFDVDGDATAASVNAVVEQLLDNGSRTFDDLSGRNAADDVSGQDVDLGHTTGGGHGASWLFNSHLAYGLLRKSGVSSTSKEQLARSSKRPSVLTHPTQA